MGGSVRSEGTGPSSSSHHGAPRASEYDRQESELSQTRSHDDTSAPETPRRRRPGNPPSARSHLEPLRGMVTSPEEVHTPSGIPGPARKPSYLRRISSTRAPHKGDVFSADDAEEEVDEALTSRIAKYTSGSLRRQPSTIRRRPAAATPRLPIPLETQESDDTITDDAGLGLDGERDTQTEEEIEAEGETDATKVGEEEAEEEEEEEEEEEDGEVSDAESFTLKDRQDAINETHPFGIRVWKPALYKKSRSVEKGAEGDIHSAPGEMVSGWLFLFNLMWTLLFGWWLAAVSATGALVCAIFIFAPGCKAYGTVLWDLAGYLFYPFGKYVKLIQEEVYVAEDQGVGRSITEYEQWQNGDLEEGRLFFGPVRSIVGRRRSEVDSEDGETDPLLERGQRSRPEQSPQPPTKRRLFGRGEWNPGRIIYFVFFYGLLTPLLILVSALCWLVVFAVPMARVSWLLLHHLRRRPLALEFHSDHTKSHGAGAAPSAIILCTYRAVGLKYWKYTVEGTNIILLNLLVVVLFVIFDYFVLYSALGLRFWLTNNILVFMLALFSVIPLAYFIGQAVASISAQSTMGVGAAVNAFFSTIVEVYLYCVALKEGKAQLVEGSIVGSIFAGILLLPGLSMCFGAVKRKTQRFNVRSAGVTTTMLLFAVIGAFGPTLFYQIYGAHELNCEDCIDREGNPLDRDCRRCFFAQIPAINDPFYAQVVRPFCWFAAVALFLSYVIGLLFTLRTHAATIWNMELDEKKAEKLDHRVEPPASSKVPSIDFGMAARTGLISGPQSGPSDVRESRLYKKILGQSLDRAGVAPPPREPSTTRSAATSLFGQADGDTQGEHVARQDYGAMDQSAPHQYHIEGLSDESSLSIVRQMAEMAAAAATVAARDAVQAPARKGSYFSGTKSTVQPPPPGGTQSHPAPTTHPSSLRRADTQHHPSGAAHPHAAVATGVDQAQAPASGGHDAPNWSRTKSYIVLLTATLAYAIIAEILVDTVDAVLSNVNIDQKFLGITLFALVPNTTEFLNAISFAMNGNIALSMEIGSAYALQVCLLQVPALVLFSAVNLGLGWQDLSPRQIEDHAFTLIFPQWDMVTTILCVFLLAYMYGEGKSNYFKGSILILSYLVVVVGFWMAGFSTLDVLDPNDPMPPGGTSPGIYRRRGGVGVVVFN